MADIAAIARFGFELDHADFFIAAVLEDLPHDFSTFDGRRTDFRVLPFVVGDEQDVKLDGFAFSFLNFFGREESAFLNNVLFSTRFNNSEHKGHSICARDQRKRGRSRLNK